MAQHPNISLIVLAYNDAPTLPYLVTQLQTALTKIAHQYEIIIVNDGSTDNTERSAKALCTTTAIKCVHHRQNKGVGAAFQTGLEHTQFDIIGYIDGDAQYTPQDLDILLQYLPPKGAISGKRHQRADAKHRLIISYIYRQILTLLFGIRLYDINCGLKLYHRSFLNATFPIFSTGPFYDAEVLIKGHAAKLPIIEIPVQHFPRQHGQAKGVARTSLYKAIAGITHQNMRPYLKKTILAHQLYLTLKRIYAYLPKAPKA